MPEKHFTFSALHAWCYHAIIKIYNYKLGLIFEQRLVIINLVDRQSFSCRETYRNRVLL